MFSDIDVKNASEHDGSGDVFELNEFIDYCETGSFIDYDGFASQILLNGFVILKEKHWFYPSDVLNNKTKLLKLQEELGTLEVVWHNR